jgi:hypothetical protein
MDARYEELHNYLIDERNKHILEATSKRAARYSVSLRYTHMFVAAPGTALSE